MNLWAFVDQKKHYQRVENNFYVKKFTYLDRKVKIIIGNQNLTLINTLKIGFYRLNWR
jgi:hypothetical protein